MESNWLSRKGNFWNFDMTVALFENGVCIEAYLLSRMCDRGVYKGFVYGERMGWGCHVD